MELYESIRNEICEVCHLLYERGYVVSNDGNVSVRVEPDKVLITPSGVGKGRMTPDMLVLCDLQGNVLAGTRYPSSESKMHLMIYRERSDVMSVVHAHPPLSTAFSICRRPLKERYLAEMLWGLGEIPVTEFASSPPMRSLTVSVLLWQSTRRAAGESRRAGLGSLSLVRF